MTGPDDINDQAAEYVLGTLDAAERTAVAARRQREPALDAAIASWDRRLGPLADLVPSLAPSPDLLAKIEQTIAGTRPAQSRASGVMPGNAGVPASATIIDLQRRLKRWRVSAVAASAIAASLLVALGVREVARPDVQQNFVAVFQKDDASPSFVMSVDLATRTLSVKRVAATVPDGKTYQLWIASDKLGVGPQSLGLVEGQNTALQKAIATIDPAIVQSALFGVSLEPAGGSPTGKPTGPVFHAHLIPTSN